ncbi:ABC transporter ATP-binding protein [Clostridium tagluense]|uniref:ABC transporter ATP-binding protein n=1 Tax=Clostridium tagluense TaxID=360422 RepID=UPI00216147BC|nr:ABC transporter ATP-binding protein [Clostridium tagluense]
MVIGILILLFREDFRVGISLSIFAFAAMYTLWKIQANSVDKWVKNREISAKFYGFLGEEIGNTEDVRSSGAEEYVMYKFYKQIRNWLPITKKAKLRYYLMWASTLGIFAIGNIIAFGVGGYLWSRGLITIGTVYLIFNYTESLSKPIEEIRTQLEDLQKAGASVARVQELLNMKSKIVDGTEKLLSTGAISVEAKNISFEYEEGVPVLKDVSFNIPKGKVLGVLGRTGSGKSTLARMLARLYDPKTGDIYIEGKKLNSVSLKELRRNTAFVTQDVQLFNATVRENLTFFNPNIKDEEILATLYDIGLQEWYNSLPNGLDTILDAGGGGLSAGEAQLLAFVRVFLKNPSLVILDEATSRLDPITEQLIERALNKLLENRTCIIIAHRLWTVQRADDILILENGSVSEYGNRERLLRDKESKFFNLIQKCMEDVEESIIA